MDLPLPAAAIASPPFVVSRPAQWTAPLVFVSAHSGADYPPAFLQRSRLDPLALRRSEDGFVDELFAAAPHHGAPLIAATFPRAFCDANREKWELDPAMFDEALPGWVNTASTRVTAGLGTIARVVASGEGIYRGKLNLAEAIERVQACWQPFHDALGVLIDEARRRFGACLVVDCHSMPSVGAGRSHPADVVVGDAHGTACAASVTRLAEQAFAQLGYITRRNDPYAGGFITRHYGRPSEAVHAIQIEIARTLYMNEAKVEKLPAFARLQLHAEAFIQTLAAQAPQVLAAADPGCGKKNGDAVRRRQV